jgi:hypothetical protein
MELLLVALVWMLNFGISIWNAYAVGCVWVETKHAGGWHRFMAWMGAVMSACGFSWCYLIFLALTAHFFGWIGERETLVCLQLGYLILVPFILVAGYAITLDSWAQAYRERTWGSYGTAAWNTYASIHNTYSAWKSYGDAFASVFDFFKGKDDDSDSDGKAVVLLIVLVAISLLAGVLTTTVIIRKAAASNRINQE